MATNFAGVYKLEKNEGMEEYFSAIGLPYLIKKGMLMVSTKVEVTKSSDPKYDWLISTQEGFKTFKMQFKLGQKFEESFPIGNFMTMPILESENVIRFEASTPKGELVRTYTFTEDSLTVLIDNKTLKVQAKRYFKKT